MNRLLAVQAAMIALIDAQEDKNPDREQPLNWELIHMISSARLAWLMAEERGEDPTLAACACSVHALSRIVPEEREGNGGTVAAFLTGLNLFTPSEIAAISAAVASPAEKNACSASLEEIVKDADIVDAHLYGVPFSDPGHKERFDRWNRRHAL